MREKNDLEGAALEWRMIKGKGSELPPDTFEAGAIWERKRVIREIDFNIQQLSQIATLTGNGEGQLMAWKQMRMFFK